MAVNRFPKRAPDVQGGDRPASSTTAGDPAVPQPRDSHRAGGTPSAGTVQIAALIEAAYDGVPAPRSKNAPAWGYRAVARLSGHLAAMHRTVYPAAYPAARQRPGENHHLLAECRAQARTTAWALRLLECHLAGEAAAVGREPGTLDGWMGQCLGAYQPAEQALIAWMEERLTAGEREQLALRYRAALARAPTRPHPRGPHAGWPGRIAFRLHAFWDGFLDAIDSRPGAARPE